MGKSDEKKLREQTLQDRSRVLAQGEKTQTGYEGRANELYPGVKSGLEDLSKTGGFDPGTYGDIMGGYKDFATTGGYTPQDIANIRSRSTSVVPSIYSRLTENLRRRGALTGGYQPGYGANLASMGRSAAELGAENARDTELGISGAVREGRLAGLSGETGLAALRQRGVMGGLGGLAGLYGGERGGVLESQGLTNQALGSLYGPQTVMATRPGAFSNVMRGIGTVAGALSPFSGLFGGGSPKMDPNTGYGVG